MPNEMMKHVHEEALRQYAEAVGMVWIEFSDEDVAELAKDAVSALIALADRIKNGETVSKGTKNLLVCWCGEPFSSIETATMHEFHKHSFEDAREATYKIKHESEVK